MPKYFCHLPDDQPDELGQKMIDTADSPQEAAQEFFDLYIEGYESSGEYAGILISVKDEDDQAQVFEVVITMERRPLDAIDRPCPCGCNYNPKNCVYTGSLYGATAE